MFNKIERNLAYIIPLIRSTGKKNCTNLARTTSKTNAKKLLPFLKVELSLLIKLVTTKLLDEPMLEIMDIDGK